MLLGFVAAALATADARASARPPVVVELFTAQGCTACAKTGTMLAGLVDRRDVIALTFPVDYWDYLGWRDTFAQPGFTDRQRAYATHLKVREIYTPEIIVDGRRETPGVGGEGIDDLIAGEQALRRTAPVLRFSRHDARVEVAPPRSGRLAVKGRPGEVWLVRYDPTTHEVPIKTGENKGKVVAVRNVVRELVDLGPWSGRTRSYALPPAAEDDLKSVVLIQGSKGGPILAAARG